MLLLVSSKLGMISMLLILSMLGVFVLLISLKLNLRIPTAGKLSAVRRKTFCGGNLPLASHMCGREARGSSNGSG